MLLDVNKIADTCLCVNASSILNIFKGVVHKSPIATLKFCFYFLSSDTNPYIIAVGHAAVHELLLGQADQLPGVALPLTLEGPGGRE